MNYKVSFCVGCGFVSGILLVVFSSSPFYQPLCDLSNTEIIRRMSVMPELNIIKIFISNNLFIYVYYTTTKILFLTIVTKVLKSKKKKIYLFLKILKVVF